MSHLAHFSPTRMKYCTCMYCVIIYEQRSLYLNISTNIAPPASCAWQPGPGDVIATPPSLPNSAYRNFNHGIHENYDHIKEQIISSAVCTSLSLSLCGLHFNKSSS